MEAGLSQEALQAAAVSAALLLIGLGCSAPLSSLLDLQVNWDPFIPWGARGRRDHGKHRRILQAEVWSWPHCYNYPMARVGKQAVDEESSLPNSELLTGLHERCMEST